MTTNFSFLKDSFLSEFYLNALEAERHAITAPRTSAFYSRLCLEQAVKWLFAEDVDLSEPYDTKLSALMHEPTFRDILPGSIYSEIHYIRKEGNYAVHGKRVTEQISVASLGYLHRFLTWMFRIYNEDRVTTELFDSKLIPTRGYAEKNASKLQDLQAEYDNKEKALQAEREENLKLKEKVAELEARQAQTQKVKKQNESLPPPPEPFSEKETRRIFIDAMLREAGWDVAGINVAEYPVVGMPKTVNKSGKGYADYVLWGDDGLPLAVIEAKKTSVVAYQGETQVKLYADCLEQMHGRRPVMFITNGFETHIHEDAFSPPRRVHGIYTKDELQTLINRRKNRLDLRNYEARDEIAGRPYQIEALRRVADTYVGEENGQLREKKREALLVMATGAGKTRTAASITDMLTKCKWAKRILFLADRNALVLQAKRSFAKMLPNLKGIDLTQEKDNISARIVFSTYPTIMNRIDSARTDTERFYGIGHFDLIIIDEAHRSVYQKYRAIFEYFDAMLLGLTATPKSEEGNRDTYRLFECEEHNPTFAYELDQAVADGYLVPPQGKPVDLGFMRRGISYDDLSPGEKEEYENTFRDEYGNVPDAIDSAAIHSWLYNTDTIDKMLNYLMTNGIHVEGGDNLGKTIIFAQNRTHSTYIQERFNKQYPTLGGTFLKVVDHTDRYAQKTIDDFSEKEKMPQIVVSVDMLDTGIDVPEIVNLVFFKSVYSSSKYWQMIGRGTRLCPDLFGPEEDKKHFYIFDFCCNFEFFKHTPDGINATVPKSLSQRIFENRIEVAQLIKRDRHEELMDYRKALLDSSQDIVADLFEQRDSFRVRMSLRYIDIYRKRQIWNKLTPQDISEIFLHIAPLVRLTDSDEKAKRFDVMLLELEKAYLEQNQPHRDRLIRKVVRVVSGLQDIAHLPQVAPHKALIDATQKEEFWTSVGIADLENIRENLRSLIKHIEKEKRRIVYTSFEDTIADELEEVELLGGYTQMLNYRQRVERYVRENQNHITVRKLRTNQPITTDELTALEKLMFEESEIGGREQYNKEFNNMELGKFIRSVVGMEVKAVNDAFGVWLQKTDLRGDQITFLKTIVDHFVQNGMLETRKLMKSPFTDIHSMGIFGVFEEKEYTDIVRIIKMVNENAAVG